MMNSRSFWLTALLLALGLGFLIGPRAADKTVTLLNVSYDPTREFYTDFNVAFNKHWQAKTGGSVTVRQSHGGSGKQARSVIDGLEADVVTLALAYDIDAISAKGGLLPADWQQRLPHNSAPYTSTIVFLVRKGNPKGIKDWDDLVKPGVQRGHAQPQDLRRRALELSGRLGLCAADSTAATKPRRATSLPGCIRQRPGAGFRRRVAPPPPSSSAASATCYWPGKTRRSWPLKELGKDKFEIVVPSISILAEPPVTLVDKVADKHGTRAAAQAYLGISIQPGRSGTGGQALLPSPRPGGGRTLSGPFPPAATVHHRRAVRWLGQGTGRAFQGWRNLRSDLISPKASRSADSSFRIQRLTVSCGQPQALLMQIGPGDAPPVVLVVRERGQLFLKFGVVRCQIAYFLRELNRLIIGPDLHQHIA
ncbi:MAG: sulfate ABC transporter substrate-binding protein [Chromatiales bacterium]|nr:sulfate ABC transporter substrate-binding protein [Chromatiales bacterium]